MSDTILWLRRDLRLADLPALVAAHEACGSSRVIPLYVLDKRLWDGAGPVRRAWLARSLRAANERYQGRIVVRTGRPEAVVPTLAEDVGADTVFISGESTPFGRRRDERVRAALQRADRSLRAVGTPYAIGPGTLTKSDGKPYQVFTPFARAWRSHGWPGPVPTPRGLHLAADIESEGLPPDYPDGSDRLPDLPAAGEQAALRRWGAFLAEHIEEYAMARDRPDLSMTSQLSGYLKVGSIHPRTMLAEISRNGLARRNGPHTFVQELAWREFYADVLWHEPGSAWHDLKPALSSMTYDEPGELFEAWTRGRTGFPMVDAGMRQLLAEGWMHNRVRMITASFLVKDLHVWWPHGARHFLAHLRDGDLASNNHGWQWTAGTGTDAAPYFRVFNPVSQGLKFDPDGRCVRRYVPELAHLAGAAAHRPWEAEDGYQQRYPERIVDHRAERKEALARYQSARRRSLAVGPGGRFLDR